MKKILVWIGWLLFINSMGLEAAAVPQLINYQGHLTNAVGDPLADGSKKLSFSIYDKQENGVKQWGPQVFPNVPVINGYFNVILGPTETDDNGTALANGRSLLDAFKSDQAFLEITVDGVLITPKQEVLSTPYAFQAEKAVEAEKATDLYNIIPKGSVISFNLSTCPPGWSEYTNAYGRFIRGIDKSGASIDPSGLRSEGHIQDDAFQGHAHWLSSDPSRPNVAMNQYWYSGDLPGLVGGGAYQFHTRTITGEQVEYGNYTPPRASIETRPKNVALLYCEKD